MSGTKNCPETPRQKMIGMMYLVLIAMLALNVSSEILNGFKLVDDSLHTSIVSIEDQNSRLYQEFNVMNEKNPKKVGEWLNKAMIIKNSADSLYDYIHHFKVDILKLADKSDADTLYARNIHKREDLQVASFYGITEGNGLKLKKRLEKYRNQLIKFTDNEQARKEIFNLFNTGNIKNKSWEIGTFENMPVSAVITILTKYQNDIRNTESKMIQSLKERTDENDARVNKFDAFVVAESNYVLEGQEYRAKVVLAAIDSTKKPGVFINGSKLPQQDYRVTASRAGEFKYSGYIELPSTSGDAPQRLKFDGKYNVGKPVAIISNDDLNILYRGYDNSISISSPGIPTDNLKISVNGGTATPKGNGKYIIKPTAGSVDISVTGIVGGKTVNLGKNTYRVKQLPDPKPYAFYKDNNGNVKTVFDGSVHGPTFVAGGPAVTAGYGEDALVQANFTVKSFAIRLGRRTYNSNGSRFSQDQINMIRNVPSGTQLIIQRIRAVGPDGLDRNLSAVAIEVL